MSYGRLGQVVIGIAVLAAAIGAGLWWNPIEEGKQHTGAELAADGSCHPQLNAGEYPGMAFIEGATYSMGANYAYPEEGPLHTATVGSFWIDQTEVTNAQFAEFITATGYVTLAERGISNPEDPAQAPIPGSAIFKPPYGPNGQPDPFGSWWVFMPGADWRHPQGPDSSIAGLEQHPVVHIAFEDAQAYAKWKGRSLATEEQFEYAALTSARTDKQGKQTANTWQGLFPFELSSTDGFDASAPVGCYTPNAKGLYDMVGNVWEWTASPYYESHDFPYKDKFPEGYDSNQPTDEVAVIKGGSYLCAPNYCMRYRPEARQGQSKGLGTIHIGFRTVLNDSPAQN